MKQKTALVGRSSVLSIGLGALLCAGLLTACATKSDDRGAMDRANDGIGNVAGSVKGAAGKAGEKTQGFFENLWK
ncbi:MAG: hypothetical protein ACE5FN_03925 [Leptospirillia bacterium]